MDPISRRLWRVAGTLALAHVVLIPICLALSMPALFADGTDGIVTSYAEGDMTRTFIGGGLESFAFLLLVPALVFLGRALGRGSETAAWAAQTGVLCGLGYVAVTFAVGFPSGAAAMYGVQHGLDVDVAFAINNLRIFGYFLSLVLLGGSTLGFAVAALAERVHPKWFGGFGVATGVVLLCAPALAAENLHDWAALVWMVWFVGVGVLMLRHQDPADVAVQVRAGAASGSLDPR